MSSLHFKSAVQYMKHFIYHFRISFNSNILNKEETDKGTKAMKFRLPEINKVLVLLPTPHQFDFSFSAAQTLDVCVYRIFIFKITIP